LTICQGVGLFDDIIPALTVSFENAC